MEAWQSGSEVHTWVVSSGHWLDDDGVLIATGYAGGDCGRVPEAVNNPAFQRIIRVGPLPCGFYRIGAPYDHPRCGKYFLPLVPNAANNMYGRSGFGCHGGLVTAPEKQNASDGCVVINLEARQAIWSGGDHDLHVISGID